VPKVDPHGHDTGAHFTRRRRGSNLAGTGVLSKEEVVRFLRVDTYKGEKNDANANLVVQEM